MYFLLFLIGFVFISTNQQKTCNPLYPRVFFGKSFTLLNSQPQNHTMIIKFNTETSCKKSFVTVAIKSSIQKYYCTQDKLVINSENIFVQYIQTCEIQIQDNKLFEYTPVGSNGSFYQTSNSPYKIYLPDDTIKVVITADWGPLKVKNYTSLKATFQYMLDHQSQNPVHMFQVNGDMAYDLNSQNGKQYQDFMYEVSQVSPFWPLLFTLGNHQDYKSQNLMIFQKTFETYNITSDKRTQAYFIGPINYLLFNPFREIYNGSNPQMYQKMKDQIKNNLDYIFINKLHQDNALIIGSHYPLICSPIDFHCRASLQTIPEVYQLFDKSHIDLYLAGHMHIYQRIYPYVNGEFQNKMKSPYSRGVFVSVVEGVAGCDGGINDIPFPQESFSASATYNKTGLGILTVNKNTNRGLNLKYQHILTESLMKVYDQFIIEGIGKKINLLEE